MSSKNQPPSRNRLHGALSLVLFFGLMIAAGLACARSDGPLRTSRLVEPWKGEAPNQPLTPTVSPTAHPLATLLPPTRVPGQLYLTPTPDPERPPPVFRTDADTYIVQSGDSVSSISHDFGVGSQSILAANGIYNPNLLSIGQVLAIPPSEPEAPGPSFKIIPDSELVNSPAAIFYDFAADIARWDGALNRYSEDVDGELLNGVEIIELISKRYSVHPRILIALLEYQGGWLTRNDQSEQIRLYPMGFVNVNWTGMYAQIAWAANQLNLGFYLWQAGWTGPFILIDGAVVPPGPGINAGTSGIQMFFSQLYPSSSWRQVVGPDGFFQIYQALYGIPFDWAIIPLLPEGLEQPELQLPFEESRDWSYTGGPHGAWGAGSAWAALDFAPPGDALGCIQSNEWVTSVADGLVLRTGEGEVLLDLDEDGYEQTGWVILFMHIESRDRVRPGQYVRVGERIGHPSCEGGVSSGTHMHLARKFNGVWIAADGKLPFDLDGWVSSGGGVEYTGFLLKNGVLVESCACRAAYNQIAR